jgi:hypothetical protein
VEVFDRLGRRQDDRRTGLVLAIGNGMMNDLLASFTNIKHDSLSLFILSLEPDGFHLHLEYTRENTYVQKMLGVQSRK